MSGPGGRKIQGMWSGGDWWGGGLNLRGSGGGENRSDGDVYRRTVTYCVHGGYRAKVWYDGGKSSKGSTGQWKKRGEKTK